TPAISPTAASRPVSSRSSRAAAAARVSPPSTRPPGRDQRPSWGGLPRSTSSGRPRRSRATSPTATTGRGGTSSMPPWSHGPAQPGGAPGAPPGGAAGARAPEALPEAPPGLRAVPALLADRPVWAVGQAEQVEDGCTVAGGLPSDDIVGGEKPGELDLGYNSKVKEKMRWVPQAQSGRVPSAM